MKLFQRLVADCRLATPWDCKTGIASIDRWTSRSDADRQVLRVTDQGATWVELSEKAVDTETRSRFLPYWLHPFGEWGEASHPRSSNAVASLDASASKVTGRT